MSDPERPIDRLLAKAQADKQAADTAAQQKAVADNAARKSRQSAEKAWDEAKGKIRQEVANTNSKLRNNIKAELKFEQTPEADFPGDELARYVMRPTPFSPEYLDHHTFAQFVALEDGVVNVYIKHSSQSGSHKSFTLNVSELLAPKINEIIDALLEESMKRASSQGD